MSDAFNYGYRRPPIRLFEGQLHLDPDIVAMMQGLEARMQAGQILAQMRRPDWSLALPAFQAMTRRPDFLATPPPAGSVPAPYPDAAGPVVSRPGEVSDVTGAVWQLHIVQRAAGLAHDEAFRQLRVLRVEWDRAPTPQRVIMITMTALVAGAMIAPIVANQPTRDFAFGLIKGHDIPVPGVDGLSFQLLDRGAALTVPLGVPGLSAGGRLQLPNSAPPSFDVNVTLDVMALLRGRR